MRATMRRLMGVLTFRCESSHGDDDDDDEYR